MAVYRREIIGIGISRLIRVRISCILRIWITVWLLGLVILLLRLGIRLLAADSCILIDGEVGSAFQAKVCTVFILKTAFLTEHFTTPLKLK